MFLSLGADWPELYIKEDYALPNYRNLKEIETIAMEYYTSDFEAVRMVIKDRDEIKTIQADMLRATEKESWKKEAITKDMIVEEWDVYIKYSGVGAEYHYGTLVPLEEEKTFGISKLMLEDMNMSFDVISDAAIFDSMESRRYTVIKAILFPLTVIHHPLKQSILLHSMTLISMGMILMKVFLTILLKLLPKKKTSDCSPS